MGMPVVEGRTFTSDDHNARLGSLIISESIKRQYWPNESALGKRLTTAGAPARVVGVVGDVHDTGLEIPAEQFVYKPMLDSVGGGVRPMMMTVRTDGDPDALVPGIRAAVEGLDPDLPITELQSMEDILGDSLSRTSFTMSLLLLAAVVALFLGSVGIYGVLSYVASQRTAEMGVRLALGADAATVRRIILSQGMMLAVVGVAVGPRGRRRAGRRDELARLRGEPGGSRHARGGLGVFLAVAAGRASFPRAGGEDASGGGAAGGLRRRVGRDLVPVGARSYFVRP
jgi:putative ABC transport system permease protein